MSAGALTEKAGPWLHSRLGDTLCILMPPFVATVLALLLAAHGLTEVSTTLWFLLIVGVDVAHVYSTMFRTYLSPKKHPTQRTLYAVVPLCGWLAGVLLYRCGAMVFWRGLAYLAVYHFLRQQYGFLRLYSRSDGQGRAAQALDKAAIYMSCLYPLLYWHTHLPRAFSWFMAGDFAVNPWSTAVNTALATTGLWVYVSVLLLYAAKEIHAVRSGTANLAKNLLVLGTAVSWYVGIVALNQDLAFTLTNVLSHGVPYLALIWLVGRSDLRRPAPARTITSLFRLRFIPLYLLALAVCAYLEEGLWDGLLWRDHPSLFAWFYRLPELASPAVLALVVPTLALPQITHYLLDGFIWRLKRGRAPWLVRLRLSAKVPLAGRLNNS